MSARFAELTHPKQIAPEVDDITDFGVVEYLKLIGVFEIDIVEVFALTRLTWYISTIIDIEETLIAI